MGLMVLSIFEWWYALYLIGLVLLMFGYLYLMNIIRKKTLVELEQLLSNRQFVLYQELLNNKKIRLAFSKQQITLLQLKGYMLTGNDSMIIDIIKQLDDMKLKQYNKLDYLLKRFTYFVETLNEYESKNSLEKLESIFTKSDSSNEILSEARLTYRIYIQKDTTLIPLLKQKSQKTENKHVKGIFLFRLAKLYYFDQNIKMMKKTLDEAETYLQNTYYQDIIISAKKHPEILNER